jgi:ATP-dependent Clp protease ATP-binding subunit ClpC
LCDKVRRSPYSLILFDEIEKADSEVLNIMLQILDYGTLTDSSLRKVSFRNCMIIMTSNIGAEGVSGKTSLGFGKNESGEDESRMLEAVKTYFTPEFTGRIDEIIMFRNLEMEDLIKISRKALNDLAERAKTLGIELSYTDEVAETVASADDTDKYGARQIKRRVTELIENELAKMIITSRVKKGDRVLVGTVDGKTAIKVVNDCILAN